MKISRVKSSNMCKMISDNFCTKPSQPQGCQATSQSAPRINPTKSNVKRVLSCKWDAAKFEQEAVALTSVQSDRQHNARV